MAHGVTMGVNGLHGAGRNTAALEQGMHDYGIRPGQRIAREGCAVQFIGSGGVECEHFCS